MSGSANSVDSSKTKINTLMSNYKINHNAYNDKLRNGLTNAKNSNTYTTSTNIPNPPAGENQISSSIGIVDFNKWKTLVSDLAKDPENPSTNNGELDTILKNLEDEIVIIENTTKGMLGGDKIQQDYKTLYNKNLSNYNSSKEKIYGSIIQAKENTEIYNLNVSATINLIGGSLMLMYLIYNAYNTKGGKSGASVSKSTKKSMSKPQAKQDTKTEAKTDTKTDTKP